MRFIIIFLSFFINISTFSQQEESKGILKGTIVDEQNEPIPGASIIVKGQLLGTSTNEKGEYELKLKTGKHIISFMSLGFNNQDFEITFTENKTLNLDIKLIPASIQITEVKIMSGGEDPAYPLMRKAIAMAPYHARQIKKYNAEIYLRGTLQIEKLPKIIKRQIEKELDNTKLEIGKPYSIESLNEIEYTSPDTFKHTIKHTQTNFDIPNFDSPIPYINSNFYSSNNDIFISPLSKQAMRHYKFRYIGFIEDGKDIINKIEVIPKRKSQQLFQGVIYLIDNLWNIHSLDLTLTNFYGSVNIKQIYSPIKNDIWLPINHTFKITAGMVGMSANARYVASVKYNSIIEDTNIATPRLIAKTQKEIEDEQKDDNITEEKLSKTDQKIIELSEKDDLSNRDMNKLVSLTQQSIKEKEHKQVESLEISGTYKMSVDNTTSSKPIKNWEQLRPIPLTTEEKQAFDKETYVIKPLEIDSIEKKKVNLLSTLIFAGSIYEKGQNRLRYNGLIDLKSLSFNPVDGFNYSQKLRFRYFFNDTHRFTFNVKGSYAFSRKDFGGHILIQQNYDPIKRGYITLYAESESKDFKNNEALNPWSNSISSLLLKDNYTRWFKENLVSISHQIDITNGFEFHATASLHKFYELKNNTNFSILYYKKQYQKNEEIDIWSIENSEAFKSKGAFITKAMLKYTPRYYYKIENGQKKMLHSQYPTFIANMEYSAKAFDTDNEYMFLEAEIFKKENNIFSPTWSWKINGGGFIKHNNVHFSRFKHFKGANDYFFFEPLAEQFLTTDYYSTSTNKWFVQGNITHSSPWLLFKNLPIISQTLWNENLHLNYLYTPTLPHHVQIGYSISQISVLFEAGTFVGFTNGKYENFGIRLVMNL